MLCPASICKIRDHGRPEGLDGGYLMGRQPRLPQSATPSSRKPRRAPGVAAELPLQPGGRKQRRRGAPAAFYGALPILLEYIPSGHGRETRLNSVDENF